MGLLSGIVGFGLGYAAGMKVGDRPVRAMRETAEQARSRARSLSETVRERTKIGGVSGAAVDVRRVGEVMTAVPETVTSAASLRDAAGVMQRGDVGDVIVVDDDRVAGVLTDRDIVVRALAEGRDVSTTLVGDIHTQNAVTIAPSATVQEAVEVMRRHDVRRLPVVEVDRLIGVVSIGDLSVAREPSSLLADITSAPPNN